tara:strand:- start:10629 stop:11297 length:669 start_codon:yes stop_codon:yes gene_type:complete
MNENIIKEKKDIKPERPETSVNRELRKTGGGGVLFSSAITVINLIGLIILFLWFFNTSGNQQQAGQNFVERISFLEESLLSSQSYVDQLSAEINSDLKFVNKEVRKLWDLSNKRNRKNITANLNSIEEISKLLESISKKNEAISAKQRALNLEIAKIENIVQKTNQTIEGQNRGNNLEINPSKLEDIQESLESFNAYRIQVNKTLLEIKDKLNELELIIENQ